MDKHAYIYIYTFFKRVSLFPINLSAIDLWCLLNLLIPNKSQFFVSSLSVNIPGFSDKFGFFGKSGFFDKSGFFNNPQSTIA